MDWQSLVAPVLSKQFNTISAGNLVHRIDYQRVDSKTKYDCNVYANGRVDEEKVDNGITFKLPLRLHGTVKREVSQFLTVFTVSQDFHATGEFFLSVEYVQGEDLKANLSFRWIEEPKAWIFGFVRFDLPTKVLAQGLHRIMGKLELPNVEFLLLGAGHVKIHPGPVTRVRKGRKLLLKTKLAASVTWKRGGGGRVEAEGVLRVVCEGLSIALTLTGGKFGPKAAL